MEQFLRSSHFSGGNAAYIEELYETYLARAQQRARGVEQLF